MLAGVGKAGVSGTVFLPLEWRCYAVESVDEARRDGMWLGCRAVQFRIPPEVF